MKIIHIIPSYLPAKLASGPIIPTHNLNKELVRNGVEVVVYTTNLDGGEILDVPLNKEVLIDGVKVYYFPISFKFWQYSYKLHRALVKNIKDFDLIHITSVFLSVSIIGAYYAKKFNKPYIISPHGSLMKEPLEMKSPFKKKIYISLVEKRNLIKATAIHFTVDVEKEEYLKVCLPLKKAIIIPNSFDITGFRKQIPADFFRNKFNISANKKIILFLSRLGWKKGLDTLIPAFAEVIKKESKAVLVLAGPDDENYKKEIEKLIEINKIEENKIVFTNMLLGDDKIAAYYESDVFVLPSYSENFGMAVVEAMAAELPVVITRGVGISKEVEAVGAGLVVEKNINQVSKAILKILENPDLAKKMGENGKKLVEEEFSSEKVAEKWIKEYNDLIKE